MKKITVLFLCFIIILSMSSCNIYEKIFPTSTSPKPTIPNPTIPNETTTEPQETTTDTPNKDEVPADKVEVDPFEYYSAIVDAYRVATKRFDLRDESSETIYKEISLKNRAQAEPFRKILKSAYAFYPYNEKEDAITFERLNYFRYDDKTDLNGDGSPELVLLTEDYDILAIYTYSQRRADYYTTDVWYSYSDPVLLATFTPNEGCWIDSEGRIHVNTYYHALHNRHTVYEIAPVVGRLNKIVEYGQETTYGAHVMYYYEIVDGEKISITQEEFDALNLQYGKYLNRVDRAEATREQSGLNTFYLYYFYGREFPEAKFRPVFNCEKQVFVEKTGEYIFLKDYVPVPGGVPLPECDVLRYVYYDVEDDEIHEAVIDCGEAQFVLTYDKGLVTLKEISNERWQEIENDMVCYIFSICSLSAPWREDNLSREEIQAIAGDIWSIEDGESTGACGTLYVLRIIVSEEPDEDGYYLVTLREEGYTSACDCPDCEAGIPRIVRDIGYMLVHERTGEIWENATLSPSKAQRLACEYWGVADGQVIVGLNKTFVLHTIVKESISLTDDFYYVIMQVEHYEGDAYENGEEAQKIEKLYRIYVHKRDGTVSTCPDYSGK